jgi:hypothetical protein
MKYSPETVKAQIDAVVSAFDINSKDMFNRGPSDTFIQNYKKLRKLAEACLEEEKDLIETLPPEINDAEYYAEILAYLKEMSAVLDQVIEPPSFL